MRPIVKLATPLATAALMLAACGGTTGGSSDTASSGGSSSCPSGISIGFFGALTGANANLGVNIRNGAELALKQHNAESGACQVTLTDYDSQGDQNQAKGLAEKAAKDTKVVGIVGPAFSGESKVADAVFADSEVMLPAISPSATNPSLSENGWKTFFRVLGNDATQGPAAASYITGTLGKKKVYVIDDASEYGKGLADIVRSDLGSADVKDNTVQTGQTDFSAVVADVQASGADAVFYGGYYSEAGLLLKQLRGAGLTSDKVSFVTDDGAKDEGLITAAGADAAEGTYITCPCLPPDKAGGTFVADYTKAYGSAPATYSAEGYDAATILLNGIKAGKVTRADLLSYVASYDEPGVTKQLKFDSKGEPSDVSVWAYKVTGGQIVADQEIKTS